MSRGTAALALTLAATGVSGSLRAQETVIAIRDVTVISATGAPALAGATVLIRGRRIEAVGLAEGIRIPAGAQIIDGRGKFLIPGLIDTHVHIAWMVGKPAMETQLGLALAYGITGHRDASGIGREGELVALRSRIDSGEVLAPRLYVSGSGTPQNVPRYQAEGLTDLIRKLAAVGVDGIKLRNLSSVQADTVISAAKAAGLPAFGHTYGGAGGAPPGDYTLRAIEAGALGVMHALGIGPAAQRAPREHSATGWQLGWLGLYLQWTDATEAEEERLLRGLLGHQAWLEPTFTADAFVLHDEWYRGRAESRFLVISYDSLRMGFPTYVGGDLALAREGFQRMQRFVRRFQEAGGLVLAGTDMLPWPGAGIHEELRLLVLAGLSPMAALQAATRNAARAFGWAGKTGTIAVGLDADLVLLDADPLQDITNTTKIWKVVRAGRVLDRAALDSISKRAELRRAVDKGLRDEEMHIADNRGLRAAEDGSWRDNLAVRWARYGSEIDSFLHPLRVLGNDYLLLFVIGLYVGRRRLLQEAGSHKHGFALLAAVGAIAVLVANLLVKLYPDAGGEADLALWMAANYGVTAFYIAGITLIVIHGGRAARKWSLLAPVGRMGLTNYLLQSLVMTLLFLPYALGIPDLGATLRLLVDCGFFFLVQVPLSHWWLARYQFGPAEWLWRSLTYGRAQPMRLHGVDPPPKPALAGATA